MEGAVAGLVKALAAALEIRDKVRPWRPDGLAVCFGWVFAKCRERYNLRKRILRAGSCYLKTWWSVESLIWVVQGRRSNQRHLETATQAYALSNVS